MHLCAGLTTASWMLEPFGDVGSNFSLRLLSRTQFAKIKNKKVIAENQCEKHKKSSLVLVQPRKIHPDITAGCPPVREKSGKFGFSSRSGKSQGIL